MKRMLTGLLFVFLASNLYGAGSLDYLKFSNYQSFMKKTVENLEKLFMEDQVEFTGEGKKIFVAAWKICQDHQKYPDTSSSLYYLSLSTAMKALEKAAEDLDTLVYDALIKFRNPEAKAKFREAVKNIRICHGYL